MEIIDISQEVFSCSVYPGDTVPQKIIRSDMYDGALYNLTDFSMCAHNGTHVDAPKHFFRDGKAVHQLALNAVIGKCYVCNVQGTVSAQLAENLLREAALLDPEAAKRILIAGEAVVSEEAARIFADAHILLLGNESQSVGPLNAPAAVHRILLDAEVVLLEGIRLSGVACGIYLLNAAPLNLEGIDGAPCRAVLLKNL